MYYALKYLPYKLRFFLIRYLLQKDKVNFEKIPGISGYWPDFCVQGQFYIGSGCSFRSFRLRHRIRVMPDAILEIGNNSFFNDGVVICASKKITIGPYAKIGDMVYIYDTDFHEISPGSPVKQEPVTIGRNVWIGAKSMVLCGSNIGDHSIISAGSILKGNIPPRSIAAGVPARVISTFDAPQDWIRH